MRLKARPAPLRIVAWALLLLAGQALQVAAVTHSHRFQPAMADAASSQTSTPDLPGHDGCVLCQVAAHAGGIAPPPAPWVLHLAPAVHAQIVRDSGPFLVALRPSHAWQGRAPPQV